MLYYLLQDHMARVNMCTMANTQKGTDSLETKTYEIFILQHGFFPWLMQCDNNGLQAWLNCLLFLIFTANLLTVCQAFFRNILYIIVVILVIPCGVFNITFVTGILIYLKKKRWKYSRYLKSKWQKKPKSSMNKCVLLDESFYV